MGTSKDSDDPTVFADDTDEAEETAERSSAGKGVELPAVLDLPESSKPGRRFYANLANL